MRTFGYKEGNDRAVAAQSSEHYARLVGGAALFMGDAKTACVQFCEQNRQLVLCCLPSSLAELADGAGFSTMLDVVAIYGGRRLYLPTKEQRFQTVTGLSVPAAAYYRWRSQTDSNGQIDIPSLWGLVLALRKAAIQFALAKQWPTEEIHSAFGISRKQLRAFRTVPASPLN